MPDIVAAARGWIGTPFHWEASVKNVGCDCRGLLAGVARELGLPEADAIEARVVGYSRRIDEAALLSGLDRVFMRRPLDERERGDVLAFRIRRKRRARIQHLGLCSGPDATIHAWSLSPEQVIETPLAALAARGVELAGAWQWRSMPGPAILAEVG